MYKIKTEIQHQLEVQHIILEREDGSKVSFQQNDDCPYYKNYQLWLQNGNTPEPADE